MISFPITRRDLLRRATLGVGSVGLTAILADESAAETTPNPLATKAPPLPARAKRLVHLFMNGGPSHVDTFDPKPLLDRFHGKPLSSPSLRTERKTAGALRSPFKFQ